jgi:hypothetical protein
MAMTIREALKKVLATLPDERLHEVLDFAEFLSCRDERKAWQQFGQSQLARAYGQDEPEYSEADLRSESAS